MNKTISCNIAGMVFNVEETAYEILHSYLKMIKSKLSGSDGADEIYADIEGRVAELFSERLSTRKDVVLMDDINAIIQAMGEPDDFVLEDDHSQQFNSSKQADYESQKLEKTLMRDTENGVIAGVCSGVSAYLGWDVVFVRILFLLALFLTGFGLIIYIVLWIAAPKAYSSTDRLRMQGKPINLDTISQEVKDASERLDKYAHGPKAAAQMRKIKETVKKFGNIFTRVFGGFLALGAFVGIAMFLTVALTENGIFVDDDGENFISLYYMSKIIFQSQIQSIMGWTGLLLTVILPILYFGILGIVLVLELQRKIMGKVFVSFLMIWILGIILFSVVSVQIGRDFSKYEYVSNNQFDIDVNTLELVLPDNESLDSKLEFLDYDSYLVYDGKTIRNSYIEVEIKESDDSLFHVSTIKYAAGISRKKAYKRIDNIQHEITLDSNRLHINPVFEYPSTDCLRRQKVVVQIEVPKNHDIQWIGELKKVYMIRDSR